MPLILKAEPFSAAKLLEVSSFQCGSELWAERCTEWIQGDEDGDSALAAIKKHQTQVWLYKLPSGNVVGFGSLGITRRPRLDGQWQNFSIIPCVAVHSAYQRKPRRCRPEDKFACQIMSDLIAKAAQLGHDLLTLDVHVRNTR